jgi:hypothetical protein
MPGLLRAEGPPVAAPGVLTDEEFNAQKAKLLG